MKKFLFLLLVFLLLCLCACTPPPIEKPYSFHQAADQIQSIDVLQCDDRYTGLHVPAKTIGSIGEEFFVPLTNAFSAIDGSYYHTGDVHLGTYVIIIHYQDGSHELLYANGSIYQHASGETEYDIYDFGTENFYTILSEFSNVAIEQRS